MADGQLCAGVDEWRPQPTQGLNYMGQNAQYVKGLCRRAGPRGWPSADRRHPLARRLRGWESGCGFDTVPGAVGAAPPIGRQPSTMLFRALDIPGLWLIELERLEDERGFFSRLFCSEAFLERGLCAAYPQWSVSFNAARGTLRGLHFQAPPTRRSSWCPVREARCSTWRST